MLCKQWGEITARDAGRSGRYLFGSSGGYYATSGITAVRAEVYDVVGATDNVEIVLHYDGRVPQCYQTLECAQKQTYVVEMKTRGGLVEDKDTGSGGSERKIIGEFHALVLASGEGG